MNLKRCVVVGADGFIGGNMVAHLRQVGVEVHSVTRQTDPTEVPAQGVDCVFFCAGNSATYLSSREPIFCLTRNVIDLHHYLATLSYRKWVHISSTSVYPPSLEHKREDAPLDIQGMSLYGAHKLLSERYVTQYARSWVVVRSASLFGPGLRKNIFYDIRQGRRDVYLTRDSYLDALNVEHLCAACVVLARQVETEIINTGSGHVIRVADLLAMEPDDYVFHEERFIDDRGLSLDKLHQVWRLPITMQEHLQSMKEFLFAKG